jgi:hypothetical protein
LLPALEATRGEIVTVRDTFEQSLPDAPVHVLRGGQATEEAFRQRAPHHRYLHLATHGYFAPEELRSALAPEPTGPRPAAGPMQSGDDLFGGQGIVGFHPGLLSGLALAGANRPPEPGKDDGVLTALEVAELDLEGVDLTVLSACETGLGEPAGGLPGGGGARRGRQPLEYGGRADPGADGAVLREPLAEADGEARGLARGAALDVARGPCAGPGPPR